MTDLFRRELLQFAEQTLREWRIPGATLVAIQKDPTGKWEQQIACIGHGHSKEPITSQTPFALASNSKLFTAAILLKVVSRLPHFSGLETRIREIVPEFELVDEYAAAKCTIKDILCHRTGLPRYDWGHMAENLDDLILKTAKPSLEFRDAYQYNNHMYDLAALLVERVSRKPFEQVLREEILEPAGMRQTVHSISPGIARDRYTSGYWCKGETSDDNGVMEQIPSPLEYKTASLTGAGAMWSTGEDVGRWMKILMSDGFCSEMDQEILPPSVLHDLQTGHLLMHKTPEHPEQSCKTYGGALRRYTYRGVDLLEHGGHVEGYMTQIAQFPGLGKGLAVLTNGSPWGDLVYKIIQWRWLEMTCKMSFTDWTSRFQRQRLRQLQQWDEEALMLVTEEKPAFAPSDLYGTWHGTGSFAWIFNETNIVPYDSRSKMERLPPFCEAFAEVTPYLASIGGNNFAGWLKAKWTSPEGEAREMSGMPFQVEMDTGTSGDIVGLGLRGLWGAGDGVHSPTGRSVRDRSEIYLSRKNG